MVFRMITGSSFVKRFYLEPALKRNLSDVGLCIGVATAFHSKTNQMGKRLKAFFLLVYSVFLCFNICGLYCL